MSQKRYPPVLKALKKYYGYDQFRPGQPELIKALLDGRDVLGIMPTGAGKSVCFQIPAIFMPGITLVVSPLISLMQDQVAALLQAHIPAAYLNSSLTFAQYKKALYFAKQGRYKIIYVAPERLNTPGFLDFAQSVDISMIAIDEAHCVSQWGQNFRPSYLEISKFANSLKKRPIMAAFTATATGPVKADMVRLLELKDPKVLVTGFDRKNLYFEVQKPRNKFAALERFLEKHPHESGIIYCLTRKETEEVCDRLNEQGFQCTRYHAGLSLEERAENQEAFLYDKVPLIAATNAFGMGIDKSNVRFVVHYSMPASLENYYQEAGRAGRDGAPAHCLLLYSGSDIMTNKFLIERSNEENENEDQKLRELHRLNQMQGYCTTPMCLRSYILQYFGENSSGHCSNCSNCTSEWITEDITEPAKEVAEALRRLPRAYGITMMIDFLKGKDTTKLRKASLTSIPGFGALHELSDEKIRMVLEGLLIQGYLARSVDQYQVISSTQKLAFALKNNEKIVFQRKASQEDRIKKRKEKTAPSGSIPTMGLLEKLKTVRRQLAIKHNLPPYIIFSDATLLAMVQKLPTDEESLLQVSGVGEVKLERYGKPFLTAIKAHIDQQNVPEDKLKKEIANNNSSDLSSYTEPDPDDATPDPKNDQPVLSHTPGSTPASPKNIPVEAQNQSSPDIKEGGRCMNSRLLLVEGLPCSGKSTTSAWIASLLSSENNVCFVDEGSGNHPADYEFHALAPAGLLSKESQIVSLSQFSGAMFEKLLPYKIYDGLDWETERPLMLEKWQEFVASAQKEKDTVYVFNCVLLQNPMCETMMRFGFSQEESRAYIERIVKIVRPLDPIVIYLKNDDIANSIQQTSQSRPGWLESVINYHICGQYGKSIHAKGLNGFLDCLKERQKRELEILSQLPVKKLVVDNPQRNWPTALEAIKKYLQST